MSGFIIAAPSSGSGKTTLTLGLLRALKRRGRAPKSGKAGPDFIDPFFHQIASGSPCLNFDPWGMRAAFLENQAALLTHDNQMLVIEAMMGLFDGAADGSGSAADLASMLGLPVILAVDCSKLSHSVAAIVQGFQHFRDDVRVAAVILNKVASARHEKMLRDALSKIDISIAGVIYRDEALMLPERHLGLVQAREIGQIDGFIDHAADIVLNAVDFDLLAQISRSAEENYASNLGETLTPLGQRIAIAHDIAFSFAYPHLLDSWRRQGAELSFFSPIDNERPSEDCDAIFLPGGYPELHAGRLASNEVFLTAMRHAVEKNKLIYGECGGYMVLGEGLIDAENCRHQMIGALPLETSFAARKRHLGYRYLKPMSELPWNKTIKAHEFHYSTVISASAVQPLFSAKDAIGNDLGSVGMRVGRVMGSYMHAIDWAD